MTDDRALCELVKTWVLARPMSFSLSSLLNFEQVVVPPHLCETMTLREPYRTQALGDARRILALPGGCGLGVNVDPLGPWAPAPFDGWPQSISPLRATARWSLTMGGDNSQSTITGLHRVAIEDDRGKVVEIFDHAARDELMKFIALARN